MHETRKMLHYFANVPNFFPVCAFFSQSGAMCPAVVQRVKKSIGSKAQKFHKLGLTIAGRSVNITKC